MGLEIKTLLREQMRIAANLQRVAKSPALVENQFKKHGSFRFYPVDTSKKTKTKTTILTWLWHQENSRIKYTAEHVNIWASMLRRNITVPHTLACVTNMPEGIDPKIKIIPLPEFKEVDNKNWDAKNGLPQCYRRLDMYRADAAKTYGRKILCLDLDVVITGNIDHIVSADVDFAMSKGTAGHRPYNGSLQMIKAGSRPQVFERFLPEAAVTASSMYIGSDQAWITFCLGWSEKYFGDEHGVYFYRKKSTELPEDCKIMFFAGTINPWDYNLHNLDWVAEHYK